MAHSLFTWRSALARGLTGLGGGFLLAQALVVGLGGLLPRLGLAGRADALLAASMLGFAAWFLALLLAFGVSTALRAAAWVFGLALFFALIGLATLPPAQAAG